MAIRDLSRKPYIQDNDSNVFVGLQLPITKGDDRQGYFASASTTIEAVKNNIVNLLNTHRGERLMQPTLGIDLRHYLFEQIDEETTIAIEDEIQASFGYWLPFVEIKKLDVTTSEEITEVGVNTISIKIDFSIIQDPNTLESITISIGGD